MLHDVLENMRGPGDIERAIMHAGGLTLLADASRCADVIGRSTSAFAVLAMQRFMDRADDEAWTGLVSAMNGSEHPADEAVAVIVRKAVADIRELPA